MCVAHFLVTWQVSEFGFGAPTRFWGPSCLSPDCYPLLCLDCQSPAVSCLHSHKVILHRARSARAGCWPVQVKTLLLESWVAAWFQVTLLRAAGPVPWGPSHCSWAVGRPPGQVQTKVTVPKVGNTAQEGCPSGGSGGEAGMDGAGARPTANVLQPPGLAGRCWGPAVSG